MFFAGAPSARQKCPGHCPKNVVRGDSPLNFLVRERNWGVVDLSLLTVCIEVIFEHFIEYNLLLVKSVRLNNTRMLKGGQDVDSNKTANDIF